MADTPMSLKALVWYINAAMSAIAAVVAACAGDGTCVFWGVAAGLEWQIANYLRDEEGDEDGRD